MEVAAHTPAVCVSNVYKNDSQCGAHNLARGDDGVYCEFIEAMKTSVVDRHRRSPGHIKKLLARTSNAGTKTVKVLDQYEVQDQKRNASGTDLSPPSKGTISD